MLFISYKHGSFFTELYFLHLFEIFLFGTTGAYFKVTLALHSFSFKYHSKVLLCIWMSMKPGFPGEGLIALTTRRGCSIIF